MARMVTTAVTGIATKTGTFSINLLVTVDVVVDSVVSGSELSSEKLNYIV